MRTCDPKRGQQILDAAAQLFANHRYHEVRMEDIAAHAGVAKGTIYRYFNDKEDLYLALTIYGMQRLFEESQDKIAGAADPEAKLSAFITHVVRFYEKYPYFLELIQRVETSGSAASADALQTMRNHFFHLVTDLMLQLNSLDPTASHHPEWSALALMGIIRGLLRFTAQPWPKHMPDWIYDQFMHGFRTTIVLNEPSMR